MQTAATTVVVADRSPLARAWSERLLADAGHRVVPARDGHEAVRLARDEAADVVVVNDAVAGLTGRDVVAALRREGSPSGIILIAGEGGGDVAAEAMRLGADDAIVKPCHERALTRAVASAAGRARARRSRTLRDQRLDGELRAASAIQEALLPRDLTAPRGYLLDWAAAPAREVGGDLLDVVPRPGGGLAVVLADVSGKGLGAALLSGMARTAFRAAFARGDGAAAALASTGRLLHDDLERTGAFLTAVVVVLDPATGRLTHADAGHGHHTIVGDTARDLETDDSGPPLGLDPSVTYRECGATLHPGECLALFSDGLVREGERLDDACRRVVDLVTAGASADEIVAAAPGDDDRTLIVLERAA